MNTGPAAPGEREMHWGLRSLLVLTLIYVFLVGVSLLESGVR